MIRDKIKSKKYIGSIKFVPQDFDIEGKPTVTEDDAF